MTHGQYRSAVVGRHYFDFDPNELRALANPIGRLWSSGSVRDRRTHASLGTSCTTRTWKEQFGWVIMEGMRARCAVVDYRGGTIPEAVTDGDSGREGDVPRPWGPP
jgi:hypothetical protein